MPQCENDAKRIASQHRRQLLTLFGLPGSGKSSLAKQIQLHYHQRHCHPCVVVDDDDDDDEPDESAADGRETAKTQITARNVVVTIVEADDALRDVLLHADKAARQSEGAATGVDRVGGGGGGIDKSEVEETAENQPQSTGSSSSPSSSSLSPRYSIMKYFSPQLYAKSRDLFVQRVKEALLFSPKQKVLPPLPPEAVAQCGGSVGGGAIIPKELAAINLESRSPHDLQSPPSRHCHKLPPRHLVIAVDNMPYRSMRRQLWKLVRDVNSATYGLCRGCEPNHNGSGQLNADGSSSSSTATADAKPLTTMEIEAQANGPPSNSKTRITGGGLWGCSDCPNCGGRHMRSLTSFSQVLIDLPVEMCLENNEKRKRREKEEDFETHLSCASTEPQHHSSSEGLGIDPFVDPSTIIKMNEVFERADVAATVKKKKNTTIEHVEAATKMPNELPSENGNEEHVDDDDDDDDDDNRRNDPSVADDSRGQGHDDDASDFGGASNDDSSSMMRLWTTTSQGWPLLHLSHPPRQANHHNREVTRNTDGSRSLFLNLVIHFLESEEGLVQTSCLSSPLSNAAVRNGNAKQRTRCIPLSHYDARNDEDGAMNDHHSHSHGQSSSSSLSYIHHLDLALRRAVGKIFLSPPIQPPPPQPSSQPPALTSSQQKPSLGKLFAIEKKRLLAEATAVEKQRQTKQQQNEWKKKKINISNNNESNINDGRMVENPSCEQQQHLAGVVSSRLPLPKQEESAEELEERAQQVADVLLASLLRICGD